MKTEQSNMDTHGKGVIYIYIYTVTYLDYIYFIFECVDYLLPSKRIRYWNPFQDSLVE